MKRKRARERIKTKQIELEIVITDFFLILGFFPSLFRLRGEI